MGGSMSLLSEFLGMLFHRQVSSADQLEVFSDSSPRKGELLHEPTGPVLMLGIDGVLHRAQTGTLSKLPLLEGWLRKHGDVEVVISSAWHDSWDIDELRALFSPDLRSRVLGTTPCFFGALRETEILACVNHYHIETWVALDDAGDQFPTIGPYNLILTNHFEGITKDTLLELELILTCQQ